MTATINKQALVGMEGMGTLKAHLLMNSIWIDVLVAVST